MIPLFPHALDIVAAMLSLVDDSLRPADYWSVNHLPV